MRMIVRILAKLNAVFPIVIIASAVLFISGCGGSNDAQQNWKVTALNSTLGAPIVGGPLCYEPVRFLVTDPKGNAAQGITVNIHTGVFNTNVWAFTANDSCANAAANGVSDISIKTDNNGVVELEFQVTSTAVGQTFFIDASSGAATPAELVTSASTT